MRGAMRQLKILLILLLFWVSNLQPLQTAGTLLHVPCKRVLFLDSKIGWIAGDDGLFKTRDGGLKWISLNKYLFSPYAQSDDLSELEDAFFINEGVGWVILGYKKILKTMDGGLSWTDQTPIDPLIKDYKANQFSRIKFIDRNHGWILGKALISMKVLPGQVGVGADHGGLSQAFILRTSDGGQSWTKFDVDRTERFLNFQFLDEKGGWLIGSQSINRTTDGGQTWVKQISLKRPALRDLIFIGRKEAWAVGWWGTVFYSCDAGNQWIQQDLKTDYSFDSVFFADRETGWLTGSLLSGNNDGILLATKDGGKKWELQYQEPRKTFNSFFIDSQEGWLVISAHTTSHLPNEYRILHTSDGGRTWTVRYQSSTSRGG